ncbi:ribonuclease M5 [Mesoplasma lactucae]|uniref:Ribonuclease M5 n=1 Tax=Mesoplasma lactucae ATCC 49193 TaxID=81460 RepID=A0A291IRZ6_9MOLU|nr:ribonuclease M5 [Mesoplasma lactucae]ATG97705.1 ribonuclease M5 [Mesoplasma lactucae ATCC 49193]ATZ19828.1 ribonuclease M5 [Mesoplasma lactucae ATCC 49193]MCL8216691.1 Ribonuclease M5 [Mesoplasma lactucae ATCC 49193]
MEELKNSLIIVEGKTDTQKLKKIYGDSIKTIETSGAGINDKILNNIKKASKNNEIIVFTDPDGPGKKIRERINLEFPGKVKNAFITKQDMVEGKKKIGIAEATEEAIRDALDNLIEFNNDNQTISWHEYLDNDFYLKENRTIICNYYSFDSKTSSKTLFKWLNWMGNNVEDVKKIIEGKNNGTN